MAIKPITLPQLLSGNLWFDNHIDCCLHLLYNTVDHAYLHKSEVTHIVLVTYLKYSPAPFFTNAIYKRAKG